MLFRLNLPATVTLSSLDLRVPVSLSVMSVLLYSSLSFVANPWSLRTLKAKFTMICGNCWKQTGTKSRFSTLSTLTSPTHGTVYKKFTTPSLATLTTNVLSHSVKQLLQTPVAVQAVTRSGKVPKKTCFVLPFPTVLSCVRRRSLKSTSAVQKSC